MAEQELAAAFTGAGLTQLDKVGAWVSFTTTRNVQVFVRPLASVARSATVVTPLLKLLPLPLPAAQGATEVAPLNE